MPGSRLIQRIQEISTRAGFSAVAVSLYDYESTVRFSFKANDRFHAASTIKVALLLAVLRAVDEGRIKLESRLHVRNRFRSSVGSSTFKVSAGHDGDTALHRKIGHAVPIDDLARAMIVRSSNLATNLLFDFLGKDYVREVVAQTAAEGIEFFRGVEDESAFEQGLNNEVTADGLLRLFRVLIDREFLSARSCDHALEILLAQEFNDMIPARLPDTARVAHKTGEISSVCHDAGIVFLPDRKPYVLAILSSGGSEHRARRKAIAALSHAVFQYLIGPAKRDE
jgi:beta-lactamase class A